MELEVLENKNEVKQEELNNIEQNIEEGLEVTPKQQNSFLESTLGKVINTAIDIGLRSVLPDLVEDQIIGVKDVILKQGVKQGIDTAINSAIDIGKSAMGIFTGNFENISQAQTAIKKGGILDSLSSTIDTVLKSSTKSGLINEKTSKLVKKGKNVIMNTISSNIEEEFLGQLKSVEKIGKYNENWQKYYEQKDLAGMEKEYKKIKTQLKEVMPLESTIKQARKIENIQSLVKNKGSFDLTQEELELAEKLA